MSRGAELYSRRPPAQAEYNWCTIIKGPWQQQLTPEKWLLDWTFGPSSSCSFPEAWVLDFFGTDSQGYALVGALWVALIVRLDPFRF